MCEDGGGIRDGSRDEIREGSRDGVGDMRVRICVCWRWRRALVTMGTAMGAAVEVEPRAREPLEDSLETT